jgi:hypothetical protein
LFQASFAHHLWTSLFFGLLVVTARLGMERVERTRRLLAAAELARSGAETDAAAAQLQALRGQVDPALMLRVMTEVQQRYTRDPAHADRLLDALVTFLRAAMPAVRSGASSLAAEMAVLQAYATLVSRLDAGRPVPRLAVEGVPPEAAFPPLELLMLIDKLARATGSAPLVRVRVVPSKRRSNCTHRPRPAGSTMTPSTACASACASRAGKAGSCTSAMRRTRGPCASCFRSTMAPRPRRRSHPRRPGPARRPTTEAPHGRIPR